jgi:DNA-binding HxlR family transcriptional regulator
MAKKSYNQLCPIAYALDRIGERWTLLILRELLFGPRRFKDLQSGLPGIGTNLLSKRLKDLESEGITRRRLLPPPAGAAVYELTPLGEALRPVLDELAGWGLRFLSEASEQDSLGVVSVMGSLYMLFRRGEEHGGGTKTDIECEIRVSDEVFHLHLGEASISVDQGPSERPDIVMASGPRELLGLLGNPQALLQEIEHGGLTVLKGSRDAVADLFSRFMSLEDAVHSDGPKA